MKSPRLLFVPVVAALLAAGCATPPLNPVATSPTIAPQADGPGNPVAAQTAADRLAAEAMDLLVAGKLEPASQKINEALRLRADRSYFHLVNALVYHLQARNGQNASYDMADQGYELAMKFDRSNAHAYYFSGLLAIDRANFAKATQRLSEALMYQKDDVAVLQALAYAAYRAGKPDVAAGAINALADLDALRSPTDLRNAAMVMAAVGEHERATGFLQALQSSVPDARVSGVIERRLSDWRSAYREAGLRTVAYEEEGGEAPPEEPAPAYPLPAPGSAADRMVVVDVVIIATEENFTTARGVNLMNGLQVQFGMDANGMPVPGYLDSDFETWTPGIGAETTRTITRSVGMPAINYSMNIFNTNDQRNEILARPTLVARAGRRSEFFSGVELNAVAVPTGVGGGSPVKLEKQIGVFLGITPAFLDDGRISLDVVAERTFLKSPSRDVAFTFRLETSKSNVNASVVMRYGETLILGGLSEKEAENTRDGVPFLQDIPGLQYLFSRNTTRDFQKSILVLLTPRPAEYVYQPDAARAEHEKTLTEEERSLASLRARYSDWFKPYPNWASVFHHMQANSLYREFRTGDVALESWTDMRTLQDRLRSVVDFLHY